MEHIYESPKFARKDYERQESGPFYHELDPEEVEQQQQQQKLLRQQQQQQQQQQEQVLDGTVAHGNLEPLVVYPEPSVHVPRT